MLRELVLPTTDRLVLIEVIVVLLAWAIGSWRLRGHSEWQLVLTGSVLLLLGGFALRAVH